VGLEEFSWGLADKKNPTDTLNARDYRYGADAPRLVNPAASLAFYPADWLSLEAVYEPWKEMSKFPKDFRAQTQAGLDASASTLKTTLAPGIAALGTVSPAGATAVSTSFASFRTNVTAESTDRNLSTPVYGARANFFLPGVDLSLSYVYDRDTYYTPQASMVSKTLPLTVLDGNVAHAGNSVSIWLPESIDLVIKRIHRFGLNAKTTIDRYGLWIESAYNLTEDPAGTDDAIRNDKISWTTGFDFNFGPASAYYLNVQYAGEWVLGYDSKNPEGLPGRDAQLTDKAAVERQLYRSLVQSMGSETEQLMKP